MFAFDSSGLTGIGWMRIARVICRSSSRSAERQAAFELASGGVGRLVERQPIAAAQLVGQRHQREASAGVKLIGGRKYVPGIE